MWKKIALSVAISILAFLAAFALTTIYTNESTEAAEDAAPATIEMAPVETEPEPEVIMTYIGHFKLTAYDPCRSCSGLYGRQTSTGAIAQANHTIAVDPRVIPYGSIIYIQDYGYYTAEDCGGAVKGNHIDIFFDTHAETTQFGLKKNVPVYLVTTKDKASQ